MSRVSRDDVDRFFQYGLLPSRRTLYIGEIGPPDEFTNESPGVDYRLSDQVIKGLCVLDSLGDEPITLIVNNPGGDEYQGLAIYDAIRATTCHTEVRIFGHAMSMAAWFTQAADHRIMYPNSTMMIHYGTFGYNGHALDFERWAKESARLNGLEEDHFLERIREKHSKYTRKQIKELLSFDTVLKPADALKLGLIDEIYQFPERS